MKLFQINEVFDRPSMDGVIIDNHGSSNIYYKFTDNNVDVTYIVKMYMNEFQYTSLPSKYAAFTEEISKMYPKYIDAVSIFFVYTNDEGNESYNLSKLGNQWFVYGKLIACLNDYISKYKPIVLKFSGANQNMDLVYDRFIKMSKKIYPQDAYVPITASMYIREEVFDILPKDEEIESELRSREEKLKNIKKHKNSSRKFEMMNPPRDDLPDWSSIFL